MPEQIKVVNCDDNEPARYAKSRILSRAGYQVFDASDGATALNLVNTVGPDLVLLDVNLPDWNGIEICRKIKESETGASVIVLQISASAISAPQATTALDNGADAYLVEPVDSDVLVATVRALLRLRSAERALVSLNRKLQIVNTELRRSNEDLAQFAFLASHDLQEPLRTVSTFIELLEISAREKLSPEERNYMGLIVTNAHRMKRLIDDLLSYSRVGYGGAAGERVDLAEVMRWTLENLREQIAQTEADVRTGPLPVVRGDASQLGQVLQNLISNAMKYQPPGQHPLIAVTAQQQGREWLISVKDNGIGVDPKEQDAIFAPFKRLHGRDIPGTGIGLAICRRIIENHGGRIWMEPADGEGSVFRFTLGEFTPGTAKGG